MSAGAVDIARLLLVARTLEDARRRGDASSHRRAPAARAAARAAPPPPDGEDSVTEAALRRQYGRLTPPPAAAHAKALHLHWTARVASPSPSRRPLSAATTFDSPAWADPAEEDEPGEGGVSTLTPPPADAPDAAAARPPLSPFPRLATPPASKTHTYEVRAVRRGARGAAASAAAQPRPGPRRLTRPPQVLRIEKSGHCRRQKLLRRVVLRETGLPARDLRRIDPALSLTTSAPSLRVSDRVLLLNVASVRLIVSHDHALLFEPNSEVAREFRKALLARMSAWTTDVEGGWDVGVSGIAAATQPAASFALECVETALTMACNSLDTALDWTKDRTGKLLEVLPQRQAVTAEILEELRLVKQSLVELDSRAGAIRRLLLEVLDDEEDVAGMHLRRSGLPERTADELEEDAEEVENLLEFYLQRAESAHGDAERLLENTRDLEESISVSLSARRFEVNKLELSLSIATFATAVGALVAGIFGMNLRNRLEMSAAAFVGTAGGIVLGCVVLSFAIFRYTRRKRIL